MGQYPESIQTLIQWFSRLPGVGYKSAERMVMKLLDMTTTDVESFAEAMTVMRSAVRQCSVCNGLADKERCDICTDRSRDSRLLCVVELSRDMFALERTGGYRGRYFVLGGKLSPLNGIGPEDLALDRLNELIERHDYGEIIIATGSDVEGEATAVYIQRMLRSTDIRVTRIAYGVPVGSSLDFADEATLLRALSGRNVY